MNETFQRQTGCGFIKHGVALLFFTTFVAGAGYMVALVDEDTAVNQNKWRVAHTGSATHAVLTFALAAICPLLTLTESGWFTLSWAVPLLSWCNSIGYTLGAYTGHRGLTPVCMTLKSPVLLAICESGPPMNVVVNIVFVFAIFGLIATMWVVWQGASSSSSVEEKTIKKN